MKLFLSCECGYTLQFPKATATEKQTIRVKKCPVCSDTTIKALFQIWLIETALQAGKEAPTVSLGDELWTGVKQGLTKLVTDQAYKPTIYTDKE